VWEEGSRKRRPSITAGDLESGIHLVGGEVIVRGKRTDGEMTKKPWGMSQGWGQKKRDRKGVVHFCYVRSPKTHLRCRIDWNAVPKRPSPNHHEKGGKKS